MPRYSLLFFLLSCLYIETATAKSLVDCRVVTEGTRECNPYGSRLHIAKEIIYDYDTKELIIEKSLPSPEEKHFVKVVSVEDMLERYLEVEDSVRFKKSETRAVSKEEVDKKIEVCKVAPFIDRGFLQRIEYGRPQVAYGKYRVVKGDSLSKLAKKFGLKPKEIARFNGFKKIRLLRIGEMLKFPFDQKKVDALISAEYQVEEGDTLSSIANRFNLDSEVLAKFNGFENNTVIPNGTLLKLPFPYVLAEKKKAEARKKRVAEAKKNGTLNLIREFGKQKLRVTATAFTSHGKQTDATPFLAAWNNRLRPGMKVIAVSRDLIKRYGMRNGTKVRIAGLPGYYTVRDKMHKRFQRRIDIYTGLDRRKALRWGRRSVVIYW